MSRIVTVRHRLLLSQLLCAEDAIHTCSHCSLLAGHGLQRCLATCPGSQVLQHPAEALALELLWFISSVDLAQPLPYLAHIYVLQLWKGTAWCHSDASRKGLRQGLFQDCTCAPGHILHANIAQMAAAHRQLLCRAGSPERVPLQ